MLSIMLPSSYCAVKRYLKYLVHFPLTSVQRMVHGSIIVLKEPQITTKCLDTSGINCHLKCQYISQNQY